MHIEGAVVTLTVSLSNLQYAGGVGLNLGFQSLAAWRAACDLAKVGG